MSTEPQALVLQEQFSSLAINRDPKEVLAEAARAANAIKEVIDKKKNKVIFNGEVYIENEDWLSIARFYGVTARIKSTNYVEFGEVKGFEATAEAYLVATGQVICTADSMCLNDEENWGPRPKYEWQDILDSNGKKQWEEKVINGVKKNMPKAKRVQVGTVPTPLFQLRSMAQTRASSKVLSMVFKWVVVLAGFRPTPAEEMDETVHGQVVEGEYVDTPQRSKPQRKSESKCPDCDRLKAKCESCLKKEKDVNAPRDPDCITEPQQKMLYAISRQCKLSNEEIKAKLIAEFKDKQGKPLEHSRGMLKVDFNKYLLSVDPERKFHDQQS